MIAKHPEHWWFTICYTDGSTWYTTGSSVSILKRDDVYCRVVAVHDDVKFE